MSLEGAEGPWLDQGTGPAQLGVFIQVRKIPQKERVGSPTSRRFHWKYFLGFNHHLENFIILSINLTIDFLSFLIPALLFTSCAFYYNTELSFTTIHTSKQELHCHDWVTINGKPASFKHRLNVNYHMCHLVKWLPVIISLPLKVLTAVRLYGFKL